MAVNPTDWKSRAELLGDLLITVDGERKPWKFIFGSDAPVEVDMTDQLAEGEPLTNPVLTLSRIYSVGETEDVDKTTESLGSITQLGNVLYPNIHDLELGRIYVLRVLHGAVDNRRGAGMLIWSVG